MRINILSILGFAIAFSSCNKDKFTTAPQIEFNSIKPDTYNATTNNTILTPGPMLSIQLTDAEGDFGFNADQDTSYVYIKNITIPPFNIDSVAFPTGNNIRRKNLNAEVTVDLKKVGGGVLTGTANPPSLPYTDTLFFEVYVRDFANNKSNIIKTDKPLYYIRQ